MNAVLAESVSFLNAEIADRDILVELETAKNLPALELDRDQMKQAFYNVIRNSFQAMKSGGILRITSALEPDYVAVSFADTGGGIAPENMGKVFDPYYTTKASGSGLGLLIVRRIVREHGGEIELRNDTGRGLTVIIRLPHGDRRARMLGMGRRKRCMKEVRRQKGNADRLIYHAIRSILHYGGNFSSLLPSVFFAFSSPPVTARRRRRRNCRPQLPHQFRGDIR